MPLERQRSTKVGSHRLPNSKRSHDTKEQERSFASPHAEDSSAQEKWHNRPRQAPELEIELFLPQPRSRTRSRVHSLRSYSRRNVRGLRRFLNRSQKYSRSHEPL